MGVATNCVKYFLFFFNFLFVIGGLVILIFGIIAKVTMKTAMKFEGEGFQLVNTTVIAIIVIGAIVSTISFFGCCGAIKEDICMLNTYAVMLIILFVTQAALGTYAYLNVKKNGPKYIDEFKKSIENYVKEYGKNDDVTATVDSLQEKFKCCGSTGPDSWPIQQVPASCCPSMETCQKASAYQEGCIPKLKEAILPHIITVGIVAICIAVTELIGGVFGFCLAHSIKGNRQYYT